ncbi:putative tRNA pseudouridine synthase B [Selenomonas ruminantium subsp. lactilytica TAM6421]|uniref:tRNA pseudouridine synthase B n=1 Tax=Selenomonas ruminantium subsp. lactilytica (strain NBRC 103574 / TAM6421) TaxID=927704 RepID=I0GRD3_SELRL|nr:tRNA pseudouridine(55) synthase TruB [Selenomonas ruminantium]BAL83320.1 putative tRNA pseudouridine synthase B [Selenomonas ruminantium subsp. lactilytica TAM6421]
MTGAKPLSGFLNILKPPGMSSHDIVGYVRRVLHTKKVGHAGTLDPAATGVLPVAVGTATRLIEYLELTDKTYRAEIKLGIATDSGDDTGRILTSQTDWSDFDKSEIEAVLEKFTGKIRQTPPAHSAIKINGQRACDLLRAGKEVEVPSREITIYRLELLSYSHDMLLIDCDCSKGTYIRSLCQDIGEALGVPATMAFLLRRRVGDFSVENALTLEELAAKGAEALLPADEYLSGMQRFDLNPKREKAFGNGLSSTVRNFTAETEKLRVYADGHFIGIGRYDKDREEILPVKVIGR